MIVIETIKINNTFYNICICPYCNKEVKIRKDRFKERKKDHCGCLNHNDARNGKHNKIYDIHQAMKQRCLNPNQKFYERYGGRGITICDEWLEYKNFKNWALENGYIEGYDIDRIDNDGNYEPSNCRFISHIENCHNRSNSFFTYEQYLKIQELGYTQDCIYRRMKRHKISFEEAISIPYGKKYKKKEK